jgi:hypothetical protein
LPILKAKKALVDMTAAVVVSLVPDRRDFQALPGGAGNDLDQQTVGSEYITCLTVDGELPEDNAWQSRVGSRLSPVSGGRQYFARWADSVPSPSCAIPFLLSSSQWDHLPSDRDWIAPDRSGRARQPRNKNVKSNRDGSAIKFTA